MCYILLKILIPISLCCHLYRDCTTEGHNTDVLAASRVGKAVEKDIWILSEACQINEDGELIPQEEQEIMWISHLYKPKRGGNDPVWYDIAKPDHQCKINLPLSRSGLCNLVQAMRNAFGGNWLSSMFLLGEFNSDVTKNTYMYEYMYMHPRITDQGPN